jgi:hypothetical protein
MAGFLAARALAPKSAQALRSKTLVGKDADPVPQRTSLTKINCALERIQAVDLKVFHVDVLIT